MLFISILTHTTTNSIKNVDFCKREPFFCNRYHIYNVGRDFGEVQGSAGPPRNTPEKILGLRMGHINPRFSAICCHPTQSASDRLWRGVRTIKISDLRGALSQNFELCQTLRSLRGKGRLRRQACPCWLLLIIY